MYDLPFSILMNYQEWSIYWTKYTQSYVVNDQTDVLVLVTCISQFNSVNNK